MANIGKLIQAFQTHFNRNRTRSTEEEDTQETLKEFEGDVNESPGDVRMNSGTHKRVYGVRRKIVGFTVVGLLLAFSLSYFFFDDDASKAPRRPTGSSAQETKTPSHAGAEATKDEFSYRDLRALDQRNQGPRVAQAQAIDGDPNVVNAMNQANSNSGSQPYGSAMPPPAGAVYAAPMPAIPSSTAASSAETAAAAAEQHAMAELEKRFASAIDFALGRSASSNAGGEVAAMGNTTQAAAAVAPSIPASNTLQTANMSITSGSPYVVQAGTLIPAMLFTGIDTSTPGQVMAQVSGDVYDSLTRSNLLIPAGARLLGTYKADGGATNGRVNVVFSTLILPNGNAFDVGSSMVAVDGGGYNGILGKVHRHTSRVIGAGMISSAIAALGSLASGNTSARDTYTGGQIAMQGALANLISTTSNMMSQGANIQPNVTVEPGHTFQVYVVQPVAFGAP